MLGNSAQADIKAVITAEDKDASKTLSAFGDNVTSASKKAAVGILAIGAAATGFAILSVKAFSDSENRIAQTNAVLKSTGSIAGVTAEQVTQLSRALERQTKFSDEDIRSVENLLLTFTAINKNIFPQTTKVVLDMSTALNEDLKSASIQVGKALQDPILGITALRRVGVNFNDSQKEVIKNLVETGQKAKAQSLILEELQREFGGSAEAAGNTLAGAMAKLKNQINNVQEAIGGMLVRAINPLLQGLLDWFYAAGGVDGVMNLLKNTLKQLEPIIPEIAGAIVGILTPAIIEASIALLEFMGELAPLAIAGALIALIAVQMGFGWDNVKAALDKVKPVIEDVTKGLIIAVQTLGSGAPALTPANEKFLGLVQTMSAVRKAFLDSIDAVTQFYNWFTNLTPVIIIGQFLQQVLWPGLQAIASALWQNLLPALGQFWQALVNLWNALNPALGDALKLIGALLLGQFLFVVYIVITGLNILIQVISGVISFISNLINWIANLIGWFGNLVGGIWNAIKVIGGIFYNLIPIIYDIDRTIIGIFGSLGSRIIRSVAGAGSWLYNTGRDIINGLVHGVEDAVGSIGGAFSRVGGNIAGAVRNALHGAHIPGFASGGIVPATPGGRLIRVAEGGQDEAIVPLGNTRNLPQIQQPAPQQNIDLNITIQAGAFMGSQIDARKYATEIYKALQDIAASKNTTIAGLVL